MRVLRPVAAAFAAVCFVALPASANILIQIEKSAQQMTVSQDGAQLYAWPVSTGQRGYDTPSGEFKPFRMEKTHFSREWDDAPMPNSIFFTTRGHAIHGTEHTRNIGRRAPHHGGPARAGRAEQHDADVGHALLLDQAEQRACVRGLEPNAAVRRRPPDVAGVLGAVDGVAARGEEDRVRHRRRPTRD